MDKHRRLKAIELSLTPYQVVVLWMKNALQGTYEEGARQSPRPRGAIANSISRTVNNSLKGQPDILVERAILQARQEADSLYMLVIEANSAVQHTSLERDREYIFLLGYVEAVLRGGAVSDLEEQFRELTLLFVREILRLEDAVSQLSAERFGGQSILFSDSAAKLKGQRDLADKALGHFNFLAKQWRLPELTLEALRYKLRPHVDRQVSRLVALARTGMLAEFGEEGDYHASFDQFNQLCGEQSLGLLESGDYPRPG